MKQIGQRIDEYQLEEILGKGGTAIVYRARHLRTGQAVALKYLNAEMVSEEDLHTNQIPRFEREVEVLRSLKHPNIVRLFEARLKGEDKYYTMELIEGLTLRDCLRRQGKLSYLEAMYVTIQVASALSEAHQKHITHRDIKPENIFVAPDQAWHTWLTDFGIAGIKDSEITQMMGVSALGTWKYMSPEQTVSVAEVDYRSDIWSLGVVLYELTTGQQPFQGRSVPEITSKIAATQPERPSRLNRDFPPELEQVILKCLEKKRENRYASVNELGLRLEEIYLRILEGSDTVIEEHIPDKPTPALPEEPCLIKINKASDPENSQQYVAYRLPKSRDIVIGRHESSHIHLLSSEQTDVSRFHAKLDFINGEFYLTDTNSTNGVFVNQERLAVEKPRLLKPLDQIQIGKNVFIFKYIMLNSSSQDGEEDAPTVHWNDPAHWRDSWRPNDTRVTD